MVNLIKISKKLCQAKNKALQYKKCRFNQILTRLAHFKLTVCNSLDLMQIEKSSDSTVKLRRRKIKKSRKIKNRVSVMPLLQQLANLGLRTLFFQALHKKGTAIQRTEAKIKVNCHRERK
jgi:hypothetical protein